MIIKLGDTLCQNARTTLALLIENGEIDSSILAEHVKTCSFCMENISSLMSKYFNNGMPNLIALSNTIKGFKIGL